MNTSTTTSKNQTISSLVHDPQKDGSIDVEAQRPADQITSLDSNSSSGGDSGDRLVGVSDPSDPVAFYPHGPPTKWETLACIAFCIVGNTASILSVWFSTPNQRPIPAQYLEDSGEYVRNLTNNEIYKGETIPTWWLFFLAVLGPGCVQG